MPFFQIINSGSKYSPCLPRNINYCIIRNSIIAISPRFLAACSAPKAFWKASTVATTLKLDTT